METVGGGLVVMELGRIKDLVLQLEGHLGGSHSQSQELCKHLTAQISSITERSISRLVTSSVHLDGSRKRPAAPSPLSHASNAPFKTTKKRKAMEKKRHQVRVSSAGAGAGDYPVDDGHGWRKYGQKEILGAKHPRGYYRCTHRHSQGCAATKQVQRTDQDPTLFDVVYLGDHTCVQSAAAGQAAEAPAEHSAGADNPIQNLSSNLALKIEELAVEVEPELLQGWGATTPFCLVSTPASGCLAQERGPLSVPSTSENCGVSPATSDSNHVVPFPPFEVAAGDVQFRFEEVMSVFDECVDDLDISSFLA